MNASIKRIMNNLARRYNWELNPRRVVNAARPANSPLHPYFEWDNDKCGEKYRLLQAAKLIREHYTRFVVEKTAETSKDVVITADTQSGDVSISVPRRGKISTGDGRVRSFVSLAEDRRSNRAGTFVAINRVMRCKEMRASMLRTAEAEMRSFLNKYRTLTELSDVFVAIQRYLDTRS